MTLVKVTDGLYRSPNGNCRVSYQPEGHSSQPWVLTWTDVFNVPHTKRFRTLKEIKRRGELGSGTSSTLR